MNDFASKIKALISGPILPVLQTHQRPEALNPYCIPSLGEQLNLHTAGEHLLLVWYTNLRYCLPAKAAILLAVCTHPNSWSETVAIRSSFGKTVYGVVYKMW